MGLCDGYSTAANFSVVGIGASAGGLRVLKDFFEHMPSDSGAAFVVVLHLSPDHESLMPELLQRHTHMPVRSIAEQMPIAPNTVFLIPPGQNLIVESNCFHLIPQERKQGHQLSFPIDLFFQSLGREVKEKAVGIILSGTGSDGVRGVQCIAEEGGLVLAQNPETAEFSGMPQNAIATDRVNLVLSPHELAQATYQFVTSPAVPTSLDKPVKTQLAPTQLKEIIDLLEQHENIDFTQYKSGTLTRRIQRRCLLIDNGDLNTYIHRLKTSVEERSALRNDLLITVTRFFRDLAAWELLEQHVLPHLLKQSSSQQTLRIWMTACATGEEAYSMAMLLRELIDTSSSATTVKIFATDVDQIALDKASSGIFSELSVSTLSQERRDRFFLRRDDNRFEVSRSLREMIIFANHNLATDVGFTNVDVVTCRNVLIYMQYQLQYRVLRNLHFALKAEGILFLGESETLGTLEPEFKPLFSKWKIYQKVRDIKLPLPLREKDIASPSVKKRLLTPNPLSASHHFDPKLEAAFKSLLHRYEATCLLLDQQAQLSHVCSDALNLLRVPNGKLSKNAIDMLPGSLQLPLSAALHRIHQGKENRVQHKGCKVVENDSALPVRLELRKEGSSRTQDEFLMVTITRELCPTLVHLSDQTKMDAANTQYVLQLENLLQQTQERLQATVEELASTNEEQQSTNEELIASNEELQSTNEELQSVNEELYTVNAEYQFKIQQLTELTNDLDNLLENIDVGVIFLDHELRIRKFTHAATLVYNLLDTDVNRPLSHLSNNLDNVDLLTVLEQAQQQMTPVTQEVQLKHHGPRLLMRISPYHTENQAVQGLILTFVNIDDVCRY